MSNGVVHVGAHKGEEISSYLAEARSPIICFEPQPLHWTAVGEVKNVCLALSDRIGILSMRVPHHLQGEERDTMSASGLPLIPENAVANGWTPTPWDSLTVPVTRFDEWADDAKFSDGSCSSLFIDVQGMELQVLIGFGKYLNGFNEIVVECSNPPLYLGGAKAEEVASYICSFGFEQVTPILQHGDIRFTKGEVDAI